MPKHPRSNDNTAYFKEKTPKVDIKNPEIPTQWQTHPATLIRRFELTPKSLGPREVIHLQRTIGNQAVVNILTKRNSSPAATPPNLARKEIKVNQGASPDFIQLWPADEVREEPRPAWFRLFKCHDAVVYWVLLSLGRGQLEATEALNLCTQKRGPSTLWIAEALNYANNNRLTRPEDANVGDILFTGATSCVTHSMVVIDADNIKGFNNFGTFGTREGGDQYSTENWAAQRFWHQVGDQWQIGVREEASFPVYRVTIGTAQAALPIFLRTIAGERDYRFPHVDLPRNNNTGCCFITTACVTAKGLPDDCEELMTLRAFRDTYLLQKPTGKQLVEIYYRYSPLIVEAIAKLTTASDIYNHLYQVIRTCVEAIKKGDNELAYATYCEMVIKLQKQFIPDITMPSYVI